MCRGDEGQQCRRKHKRIIQQSFSYPPPPHTFSICAYSMIVFTFVGVLVFFLPSFRSGFSLSCVLVWSLGHSSWLSHQHHFCVHLSPVWTRIILGAFVAGLCCLNRIHGSRARAAVCLGRAPVREVARGEGDASASQGGRAVLRQRRKLSAFSLTASW